MKEIMVIVRKELKTYFGSPMAAIFIGAFLLVSLFSFFWVETFFARNIADIRPLFRWMPLLLIFLVAALTMRQWSEEERMGTLEILLTLPVRLSQLVLGKFLAVLALVGLALLLTGGLPLTVAILGNLDWGPVIGGYLGALLLAAAYIAIGLYISSRTDNQIIALILTVLLGGFFYLLGSAGFTAFMGNRAGDFFRALGTGSRFSSIERGVIDLRDLVYYGSLTAFFLVLNGVALARKSWSGGSLDRSPRRQARLGLVLLAINLVLLNVWLARVHTPLRLDLTEQKEYSLSASTRDLISNLPEPLLLRGYFSAKTHPLLAPLVPRIKDLMNEYRIASGGKVEVSFVDPRQDEEVEREANQLYGIKPVPFQVAGRYEAAVVNSYFHILVKYGDQFVTLGYNDLIEVHPRPDGEIEVGLRNLEYDLTKSIKKAVYGFQSLSSIFAKGGDYGLTLVVTPDTLPESLKPLVEQVRAVAADLVKEAGGKLHFVELDPDRDNNRQEVMDRFKIEPLAAGIFSDQTFFLHLMLTTPSGSERIFLGQDMGKAEIRQDVEAALKRHASGFLKTVGIWLPPDDNAANPYAAPTGGNYRLFQEVLRENYNLERVDLQSGRVGGDIDTLLLVAPQNLNDLERLAVDQYLMRGGAVIVLAGAYQLDLPPGAKTLNVKKIEGGLAEVLASYGITIDPSLIMDKQNEPFPIPVNRDLGGFVVQEIRQLDYPYFVDVRSDGMSHDSPVTASLPAVTMNWASPLLLNEKKNDKRRVTTLLSSSPDSWVSESTDIQPDFQRYPSFGFGVGEELAPHPLAVSVQGVFDSYFAGRPDPRQAEAKVAEPGQDEETPAKDQDKDKTPLLKDPLVTSSPDSARLVVVGSSEFINDTVLGISRSTGQDRFMNSLEFLQNLVDWSVADEDLLAIRSRGTHARLLVPLTPAAQAFWEWLNYGLALLALLGVALYGALKVRRETPMPLL